MNSTGGVIYEVLKPASWIAEIPVLLAFNLLLVASSYVSINLPFSPVPITGQTFGVLLIAMTLGKVRGTGIVLAYLIEGSMGLPVFAGGAAGIVRMFGPTGGYLIGFLLSAYLVGYLADRGWDKGYVKSILAMLLGTAVIFSCGLLWLARFVPEGSLFAAGLYPFLPGSVIKISMASVILPSVWKFIQERQQQQPR